MDWRTFVTSAADIAERDQRRAHFRVWSSMCHDLYHELTLAGFTPEQAMEILQQWIELLWELHHAPPE